MQAVRYNAVVDSTCNSLALHVCMTTVALRNTLQSTMHQLRSTEKAQRQNVFVLVSHCLSFFFPI